MHKVKTSTIASALVICTLVTASLLNSPPVEGSCRIMLAPGILSASALGENTHIFSITLIDNTGENYHFTASGQTILDIPENRSITSIYVDVKLNDNYADTGSEAEDRTRIDVVLTDPDGTIQFENTIDGATDSAFQLANYYYLSRLASPTVSLFVGTWSLTAEYEVLAPP